MRGWYDEDPKISQLYASLNMYRDLIERSTTKMNEMERRIVDLETNTQRVVEPKVMGWDYHTNRPAAGGFPQYYVKPEMSWGTPTNDTKSLQEAMDDYKRRVEESGRRMDVLEKRISMLESRRN